MTYINLLLCCKEINLAQKEKILQSNNNNLISIMNQKLKFLFQFNFLESDYFDAWIQNPLNLVYIRY